MMPEGFVRNRYLQYQDPVTGELLYRPMTDQELAKVEADRVALASIGITDKHQRCDFVQEKLLELMADRERRMKVENACRALASTQRMAEVHTTKLDSEVRVLRTALIEAQKCLDPDYTTRSLSDVIFGLDRARMLITKALDFIGREQE